jgi:hypothetical protein
LVAFVGTSALDLVDRVQIEESYAVTSAAAMVARRTATFVLVVSTVCEECLRSFEYAFLE